MILEQTFKNHLDEQGHPKVQRVSIQSSVGVNPEDQNISIYQWGLSIRCQLQMLDKKISKLEKRDNYLLFNNQKPNQTL